MIKLVHSTSKENPEHDLDIICAQLDGAVTALELLRADHFEGPAPRHAALSYLSGELLSNMEVLQQYNRGRKVKS